MKTAYGIDVQGDTALVVRADRAGSRVSCVPASVAAVTPEVLSAACLTPTESVIRWLETPYPSRNKAMKVIPTLLDVGLPFPIEDCAYTISSVQKTAQGSIRALAVVARTKEIMARLDSLKSKAIDPPLLDNEALAIWTQSLRESPSNPANTLRLVAYLGNDRITVCAGINNDFVGAHGTRSKDAAQTARWLKSLPLPPAVSAALWIVSGPAAIGSTFVAEVSRHLGEWLPARTEIVADAASFLARALATRAVLQDNLPCNLRTGELTHALIRTNEKSRMRTALVVSLVSGLLLCATNLAAILWLKHCENAADRAFSAMASDLAGYDIGSARGEHAIKIVNDSLSRRMETLRPFLAFFEPSLLDTITPVVALGKKKNISFEKLVISRSEITLAGAASDWNSCDTLVQLLKTAGYRVLLDRKEAGVEELVPFSITTGGKID